MIAKRWTMIVAAAGVLALAATACSSGGSDGGGGGGGNGGGNGGGQTSGDVSINIKDFQFDPSSVDVGSGKTAIQITNNGTVEHSFTLDDGSVSKDIQPGQTVTVTVDVTADAPFHCEFHPTQMKGTLVVSS